MIGDSNDESNYSNKLLLTDTQVLKLCDAFANDSSTNIKLSKNPAIYDGTVKRISW